MTLPSELVSELIEVTTDRTEIKQEATVRGTIVERDGTKFVKLDGSDLLTPISTTVDAKNGERVTVLIKDHKATVTGNTTAPAARDETVTELGNQVNGRIDAEFANIDTIVAGKVEAQLGEFDEIYVKEAEIDTLVAGKVEAEIANLEFAKIEDLEATNAKIDNLDVEYANIDFANVTEADIDKLFARSAIIEEVTSSDGTFTRKLIAVTINGDLIEASTIKVDKLIVKGTDGNYYALNTDFSGITGVEPVEEDAIHGSILIAKSITADKVSVTDLVAFGATIGGFNITNQSLYSGVKASADNTTQGVYLDKDGQMSVGDLNNFFRYYKDDDGAYRLEIAASSLVFGTSGKTVEQTIEEATDLEIGARNLIRNSETLIFADYGFKTTLQDVIEETYQDNGVMLGLVGETIQYADEVALDGTSLVLVNPSDYTLTSDDDAAEEVLVGKYVYCLNDFYRIPSDAVVIHYSASQYVGEHLNANQAYKLAVTGGLNAIASVTMTDPHDKVSECIQFTIDNVSDPFVLNGIMTIGETYTLSLWISSESNGNLSVADDTFVTTNAWNKYSVTFVADSADLLLNFSDAGVYYIYHPQLEIGVVDTDWTPAPEDQTDEMNARFSVEADRIESEFTVVRESINDLDEVVKTKYTKNIVENENGISITDSDGIYEIQLDNVEGVTIRKNGEIRSQLVDDDFFTGNMVVKTDEKAQFGNFALVPRSDGSLSFLKVGD